MVSFPVGVIDCFHKEPRPSLGTTQPSGHCVLEGFSPGKSVVAWSCPLVSISEIKNDRSCNCVPPTIHMYDVNWNNFTLYFHTSDILIFSSFRNFLSTLLLKLWWRRCGHNSENYVEEWYMLLLTELIALSKWYLLLPLLMAVWACQQ